MAKLVSSRKVGGLWKNSAPGAGSPYNDCHNVTEQSDRWYRNERGECSVYQCECTQRRCFDGVMTPQKYVEIFEDVYEDADDAFIAARVGAYTGAGGAVIVGIAALASNPVGWAIILGTVLVVVGTSIWVESDRLIKTVTIIREADSGLTRTGFSGKYTIEVTDCRVLGNPSHIVPCEEIPAVLRENTNSTHPVTDCLDLKGKTGKADDFICSSEFARGS